MNEKLIEKLPQLDRIEYQIAKHDIENSRRTSNTQVWLLILIGYLGAILIFAVDRNTHLASKVIELSTTAFVALVLLNLFAYTWSMSELNKKFMQKFDIRPKGKR